MASRGNGRTGDATDPQPVRHDRGRSEHRMAPGMRRPGREKLRQDRRRPPPRGADRSALASCAATVSHGDEHPRDVRSRRRALVQREAGRLGGRRGLDLRPAHPQGAAGALKLYPGPRYHPAPSHPSRTWALIAVNIIVFLYELSLEPQDLERLFYLFG